MRCWIFVGFYLTWAPSLGSKIIVSEKVPVVEPTVENGERNRIQPRIVGGSSATCEEFPHQVSYIVNNSYFCGGFIVSKRFILTAAHCAQDVDPSTVVLRSGSTFRRNGTILPIIEVIPNPEYNHPELDKDIAVMKTAETIKFDSCTQPIKLPPKGFHVEPGSELIVSGWGRTEQDATTIPERLMAVGLTVVDNEMCQSTYFELEITENMLCAGNYFLGGESACQGDSGGVGAIDGVAIGIVSFSRGCGQPLSPTVFTNLTAPLIRKFITQYTGL